MSGQRGGAPLRKSVRERMAALAADPNPLVETGIDLLNVPDDSTSTFSVASTGELVLDDAIPLPISAEREAPRGQLDELTASAYHLLLLPETATPEELEALVISVWNEAGWLQPGILGLQSSVTLEGAWALSEETADALGVPPEWKNVWLLRCPPARGAAPAKTVQDFDELARAFPEGMPVGVELKTLEVLKRVARRLGGALRIAGSGHLIVPEESPAVSLRVYSDQWLNPKHLQANLEYHLEAVSFPQPPPEVPGSPYALLVSVSPSSQVLIGVRPEHFPPRALRYERWISRTLFVYEVVWVPPPDLTPSSGVPSRRARLERGRALRIAETSAAVIAASTDHAAIIDDDGFLLALDEPPQEEGRPRP